MAWRRAVRLDDRGQAATSYLRGRPRGRLRGTTIPWTKTLLPRHPTAPAERSRRRGTPDGRGSRCTGTWRTRRLPATRRRTAPGRRTGRAATHRARRPEGPQGSPGRLSRRHGVTSKVVLNAGSELVKQKGRGSRVTGSAAWRSAGLVVSNRWTPGADVVHIGGDSRRHGTHVSRVAKLLDGQQGQARGEPPRTADGCPTTPKTAAVAVVLVSVMFSISAVTSFVSGRLGSSRTRAGRLLVPAR